MLRWCLGTFMAQNGSKEETRVNIWIPKPLCTPCPPTQMFSFFLPTEAFSQSKWCLCKRACGNHVYDIRANKWFPPPQSVHNLASGTFLKHLSLHVVYTSSCEFHLIAESGGVWQMGVTDVYIKLLILLDQRLQGNWFNSIRSKGVLAFEITSDVEIYTLTVDQSSLLGWVVNPNYSFSFSIEYDPQSVFVWTSYTKK